MFWTSRLIKMFALTLSNRIVGFCKFLFAKLETFFSFPYNSIRIIILTKILAGLPDPDIWCTYFTWAFSQSLCNISPWWNVLIMCHYFFLTLICNSIFHMLHYARGVFFNIFYIALQSKITSLDCGFGQENSKRVVWHDLTNFSLSSHKSNNKGLSSLQELTNYRTTNKKKV